LIVKLLSRLLCEVTKVRRAAICFYRSQQFLIQTRNFMHFMESGLPLPFLQGTATSLHPELDESNPRTPAF